MTFFPCGGAKTYQTYIKLGTSCPQKSLTKKFYFIKILLLYQILITNSIGTEIPEEERSLHSLGQWRKQKNGTEIQIAGLEPDCLGSSHFLEPQFHQCDLVPLPQPLRGSVSSPVRWTTNLTEEGPAK